MTVFTRSFLFLWACLFASNPTLFANSNPPVLTNPSACQLNLFITEAGCGPANEFMVDVANAPGISLGSDVYLKELRFIIEHEWAADLDIFLKSPSGVLVEITTDNGDAFDHYGNPTDTTCGQFTTFLAHASLSACNLPSVTVGDAPFIGSYLPEGNFSDFNDGSSPIGLWTLMVCDDGASNLGHLQFVELVFESTGCVAPSEITVLQTDSTSVLLDWVAGTGCDSVIFEFGPTGFTPGTGASAGVGGTVLLGGCPPFVLTGLAPTTAYDVYLRENCGSGNYSTNTCPVQVTTTCSPHPATIVEDFDQQALCEPFCGAICPMSGPWRNALNDHFDWLVNTDTTLTTNTGPPGDYPGGGNYIYLEASGLSCRNGKRAELVSNCIQVVANLDSCDFSFNYNFNGVHINGMSLEITTDGGVSWAVLWGANGNKGPRWHKKFIDLDAYHGLTAQFRFVGKGGNGQFADLALDNLVFYGSIDLGAPDNLYYLDADGDGFGDPNQSIASCQPASFPNYVDNADDCDDLDFYINPGVTETLCDYLDANCNGDGDEFFVAPVTTESFEICSGEIGFLVAVPANFGEINWFDSLTGGQIVGMGDSLFLPNDLLVNNGLTPLEHVFYAEENTVNNCVSIERTVAVLTIKPSPKLVTNDTPGDCAGEIFDLTTINISDESGLNGSLSYFDQLPFVPGDEVGPIVLPTATTTYQVLSEAANGCRDTLAVTYTVQPSPVASIPDAPTLCRNSSKTISVNDLGSGTAPYDFQWNTSETTASIQIFSDNDLGEVNTYVVTITDGGGCSSSDTLSVTTIENIEQLITSSTPVSTCDGSDGSVSVTPLDGNPGFTYEWAGGTVANQPGGLTVTGLQQGSYSFTVTDSSPEQCRAVVPVVVVNGPAAIVSVGAVQHVDCHGGNDGCITLDVIGGPNTTIAWSNGMQGANICELVAGTYTATVTEGGCENVITIPISEPEVMLVKPETAHVSCFGGNDGRIGLTIFGGTPPMAFRWGDGSTEDFLEGLTAGFYDLTVTDGKGCEAVLAQIPVTQPTAIALTSLGFEQPSCHGQSDGSISIEAGGGVQPYAISWSNGGTGTALSNIAEGSYTVTIRDQNACEYSQAINLAQPQPLGIVPDGIIMPACAGENTGSIVTEVSGGTGAYFFLWNNGATTPDLTSIGNGSYAVTVTDQNGCTGEAAFAPINSPEVISAGISQQAPFCIGVDSNCLEVVVFGGGSPPFSFDWSTDDSDQELCNLSYGSYTVTITDDNGCTDILTTSIDSVQVLTLGYEAFPPLCFGQTGQLAMTVAGGTAPYAVLWSDGQTGLVASNLLAQNHAATVTDATGCANTLGIIPLEEPDILEANVATLEGISCHGGSEGAIDISVNGGTAPYHFQWTNGPTTEDLTGLSEGNYGVVITDDNGCTASIQGLVVESPAPLSPSSSLGGPTNACETVSVENLCVDVAGGVAPYLFAWDTGDTTECLNDPLSGDYHVTITDAAGCTLEFMSLKVPENYSAITLQALNTGQPTVCYGDSTGVLNLVIEGGVGPFQYNWNNGVFGLAEADLLSNGGLPVGSYMVTVTDEKGCTAVSPSMAITSFGAVTPTINTNLVQHVTCKHGNNGAIPVAVSGGLPSYTFHWENGSGAPVPGGQLLENLSAGSYFVTVFDQENCMGQAATTVLEPTTEFIVESAIIQHVACFGDSMGSILALPQGGELPYNFLWSTGQFSQGIQGLPVGEYGLTATDGNGCERQTDFTILGPSALISVAVVDSAGVSCFGGKDGFINIDISGGTPGYSVNWNAVSGEEDLNHAFAGEYLLSIFDSMGCPFTAVYELGSPAPLGVDIVVGNQTQLSPPNGGVSAVPFGGTPDYSYEWSNMSFAPVQTGLPAGDYGVTVTDANGCETSQWVEVDLVLGAWENYEDGQFALVPNPTTGSVALVSKTIAAMPLDLRVFNQFGQLVFLEKGRQVTNGRLGFDLTGLPAGVYQASFTGAGGLVFEGKIVVFR